MAAEIVTTKTRVQGDVFEIPAGVSKKDAVSFAETALEVCRGLMSDIVADSEQNAPDIAWATRFLIESALACYRATGSQA
jgi:hypothetical protein